MKFISNKGKTKQIKYSSGMIVDIPEGSTSLPDDPNLDKMVNSSGDLSFITKEEFYKERKIIPTKDKIEAAKKEKPTPKPPKKSKKKAEEKPKEKTEEKAENKQGE